MMIKYFLASIALSFICMLPVKASAVPKAGDVAIDFKLKEIRGEGKQYSLTDFKGRVILLNIWAGWCSGCKEEMPHFMDIQQMHDKNDFLIVAVSIDRVEKYTVKFLENLEKTSGKKVNFLVLIDEKNKIGEGYNPFGLPASYLIDRNGIIRKIFYGAIRGEALDDLKKEIDALLKEK